MTINDEQKMWLNDFAKRGFRDIADQDYIAARQLYRSKLHIPFLWSAQQAVEKYLKAILLFNGIPVKGLSHNIEKSLEKVKTIERLKFCIPNECEGFISYLNQQGPNRYFEVESYIPFGALLNLDKTIWNIRKYCDYFNGNFKTIDGKQIDLMDAMVNRANSKYYNDNPHTVEIMGGYLEQHKDRKTEAGRCLIWNNFYFGRRARSIIRKFTDFSHSATPTHVYNPEALEFLALYAKIDVSHRKT